MYRNSHVPFPQPPQHQQLKHSSHTTPQPDLTSYADTCPRMCKHVLALAHKHSGILAQLCAVLSYVWPWVITTITKILNCTITQNSSCSPFIALLIPSISIPATTILHLCNLCTNVHSNFICISPKPEATQMSFSGLIVKRWHIHTMEYYLPIKIKNSIYVTFVK